MNAMILYDNFDLAAKANALLERTAYRMDEVVRWNVKPWRLDLLRQAWAADAALAEAVDAHLLVLAVRNQADLPPGLLDWLAKWAAGREVQDAALAVLEDGGDDAPSAKPTPDLSQFAADHSLGLIPGEVSAAENESAFTADRLHERAVAQTPTLLDILAQQVYDGHRGWGINE